MEDLLINKIAPLCPFLYITLRALNRKFRSRLPLDRIRDFMVVSHLYLTGLREPYDEEREFGYARLIHCLIPYFRPYSLEVSLWKIQGKRCYFHRDRVSFCPVGVGIREDILGLKRTDDFFEHLCKSHGCRLNCCESVWGDTRRKEHRWMLSYDGFWKVYVIESV